MINWDYKMSDEVTRKLLYWLELIDNNVYCGRQIMPNRDELVELLQEEIKPRDILLELDGDIVLIW
jgi:hypothetical protein